MALHGDNTSQFSRSDNRKEDESMLKDPNSIFHNVEIGSHIPSYTINPYNHQQFSNTQMFLKSLSQVSHVATRPEFCIPSNYHGLNHDNQTDDVHVSANEQSLDYGHRSGIDLTLGNSCMSDNSLDDVYSDRHQGMPGHVVRTRRRKAGAMEEARVCVVCSEPASGYNFDRLTCESCKAFFRRNALKARDKIKACSRNGDCNIEGSQRKHCPSCRLEKCLAAGMKKELILPPEKLEQRAKPKRRKQHSNDDGSLSSCGEGGGGGRHSGVLFSPSVAQQLAAAVVGGGGDSQTSPVSPQQHRREGGFMERYGQPHLPSHLSLYPSQQHLHPSVLPPARRIPPPSLSQMSSVQLPTGEQENAAGSRTLNTLFSSDLGGGDLKQHPHAGMMLDPNLKFHLRGSNSGSVPPSSIFQQQQHLQQADSDACLPFDLPFGAPSSSVHQSTRHGNNHQQSPPPQWATLKNSPSENENNDSNNCSVGLVRLRRCRFRDALCYHSSCRRLFLKQQRHRLRTLDPQQQQQHNQRAANFLNLELECPDETLLTCIGECVARIREPFTPEEPLETEAAETLEQEYNRMDTCIRRIIRVVKVLPYFNEIGKPAQLGLLRANIYGLIVLYSSFFFERDIRKLRYPIKLSDGSLSTVTVSMLDDLVTSAENQHQQQQQQDLAVSTGVGSVSGSAQAFLSGKNRQSAGLREDFELYKANTLAAFNHLDDLTQGDDTLRMTVLAIKLFADDSLPEEFRDVVVPSRRAYLVFLWTYIRWRAGPRRGLRRANELFSRLHIAFVDLKTLEIRMTEFAKLLSLDGLSPLMREVCSQRSIVSSGAVVGPGKV